MKMEGTNENHTLIAQIKKQSSEILLPMRGDRILWKEGLELSGAKPVERISVLWTRSGREFVCSCCFMEIG